MLQCLSIDDRLVLAETNLSAGEYLGEVMTDTKSFQRFFHKISVCHRGNAHLNAVLLKPTKILRNARFESDLCSVDSLNHSVDAVHNFFDRKCDAVVLSVIFGCLLQGKRHKCLFQILMRFFTKCSQIILADGFPDKHGIKKRSVKVKDGSL